MVCGGQARVRSRTFTGMASSCTLCFSQKTPIKYLATVWLVLPLAVTDFDQDTDFLSHDNLDAKCALSVPLGSRARNHTHHHPAIGSGRSRVLPVSSLNSHDV